MSGFAAYPEYRDSGVEWLGAIPSDWKLLRYKNVLKIMQGMAFKSSEYVENSSGRIQLVSATQSNGRLVVSRQAAIALLPIVPARMSGLNEKLYTAHL